ncbi:MAG: hypothetical protein ACKPKO_53845, partial [Candidatus Fonsibacter sp.]
RIELLDQPLRGSDLAELLPNMGHCDEHDDPHVKQGKTHARRVVRLDAGREHSLVISDKVSWSSPSLPRFSSVVNLSFRSGMPHERSEAHDASPKLRVPDLIFRAHDLRIIFRILEEELIKSNDTIAMEKRTVASLGVTYRA